MNQAVKIVKDNKGIGGPVGNSAKKPKSDEDDD